MRCILISKQHNKLTQYQALGRNSNTIRYFYVQSSGLIYAGYAERVFSMKQFQVYYIEFDYS